MNCVILQKVVYRLPGSKRPVYGVLVGQNEDGISLLFIKKPNGAQSHSLALAVENVEKGFYEDAKTSQFALDKSSIAALGLKLQAIAGGLDQAEIEQMLEDLL
jgi:hypothetical protein